MEQKSREFKTQFLKKILSNLNKDHIRDFFGKLKIFSVKSKHFIQLSVKTTTTNRNIVKQKELQTILQKVLMKEIS